MKVSVPAEPLQPRQNGPYARTLEQLVADMTVQLLFNLFCG